MLKNVLRELSALNGQRIVVPIEADERGFVDRQCPSDICEFLFKVNDEDWRNICRDESVWCPMCGHAAEAKNWFSKDQIAQAEVQARKFLEATIDNAMRADARAFNSRQPKNAFVKMSMRIGGAPQFSSHILPAAASEAMQLEVACDQCSCRFAVIGSAYFCPACGHNSVDRTFDDSMRKIRAKIDNLQAVRDAIAAQSGKDEAELTCRSLIESCLQDGVTAFQRCCERLYASAFPAASAPVNVFQRLTDGSKLWEAQIGVTYSGILGANDLTRLGFLFQKRHLLAHSDGVVDQRYIDKSGDHSYKVGQRVSVSPAEAGQIVTLISALVHELRRVLRSGMP